MKRFWSACLCILLVLVGFNGIAQEKIIKRVTLDWSENQLFKSPIEIKSVDAPNFVGGQYGSLYPYLPTYSFSFSLKSHSNLDIQISNIQYADIKQTNGTFNNLKNSIDVQSYVQQSRRKYKGFVEFIPIIQSTSGIFQKMVSFDLEIQISPTAKNVQPRNGPFAESSKLNTGQWYKIATTDEDVYKIDLNFFTSNLGINASTLNPSKIKLYGNGGGVVPQANNDDRTDDLEEISIQFVGDQDDIFEADEFFLFYAESSDNRIYNGSTKRLDVFKNPYSFNNHYFIRVDGNPGLRVASTQSSLVPSISTSEYLDIQHYENELFNVLDYRPSSHGSGKRWFGELFTTNQNRSFTQEFDLTNYVSNESISWVSEYAVVSFTSNTRFSINIGDGSGSATFATVQVGTGHSGSGVNYQTISGESSTAINEVDVEFIPSSSESLGWLDYIQIIGNKNLSFTSSDITRHYRGSAFGQSAVEYILSNSVADLVIWDINNRLHPRNISYSGSGSSINFVLEGGLLNEFVAIDPSAQLKSPMAIGSVMNQNLHSINRADLLVVYPSEFKSVAENLMAHRQERDGLMCQGVDINHVYNEFSAGSVDASGLRDFIRMVYERDPSLKYVLLVGDGSFDMRHIRDDVADQNFICTYQTTESEIPIKSYPTDDFFVLLDDNEGGNILGGMDLGIGRFPIQSVQQGTHIVDKIIQYETDLNFKGDWKQFITLVADDEDGNEHFKQSRNLGTYIENANPEYELSKINLDAFEQEANSAGDRYPDVNRRINSNYQKGQFLVNYYGHGGNRGLGQERILTIPDILSWEQNEGYPIIVTATCSFASYDDPDFESAGEITFNQGSGGAVALLSTTRIVFSAQNNKMVRELFDRILEKNDDGTLQRIGDIFIDAKNDLGFSSIENSRKFALFGDPSMQVPLPLHNILTTSINDKNMQMGSNDTIEIFSDTLGALQRVTVKGFIADNSGNKIQNFNGELSTKVFDKPIVLKTLGQDQGSNESEFRVQNNILYQGRSSVVNGDFSYSFIIPRDINYAFGDGKILHYAKNQNNEDAGGVQQRVIIGGTAENGIVDNQPPIIELFLNTESFENGGIVTNRPVLLANLSDDFGINIAGTSVGHDLVAIVDGDVKNSIILNEFYKAKLDKATEGSLKYQLTTLEEGLHQLTLRVWDIANNKAEASIEFIVMDNEDFSISRVFNYPNPFTTYTGFQFVHDLPSNNLDVQIDIFTIGGHLIKSIQEIIQTSGGLAQNIAWDGLDDYGDQLARGVYLYKISVISDNISDTSSLSAESDFERLVILK